MGLRYRKSINLGMGFRVNISKSGIGYSWGVPGYRKSVSATGKVRTTYSIPKTGISYTVTSGKKNHTRTDNLPINNEVTHKNDVLPVQEIESADINNFQNGEFSEFAKMLSDVILLDQIAYVSIWLGILFCAMVPPLLILFFLGIILKAFVYFKAKNCIQYDMDEYSKTAYQQTVQSIMSLNKCNRLWQITSFRNVANKKINAGVGRNIDRSIVKFSTKTPYYLQSNFKFPNIKLKKETLYFLPDKLLIIRGHNVGAVDYKEINIVVSNVIFIEDRIVPRDAQVIGKRWQYINKNGTPDKRYKNNRQLPECRYGKITITSSSGINVELQGSNYTIITDFASSSFLV